MKAHHLDTVARAIFRAAETEDRCGELLECLFDGGSATIDYVTGKLTLASADHLSQMVTESEEPIEHGIAGGAKVTYTNTHCVSTVTCKCDKTSVAVGYDTVTVIADSRDLLSVHIKMEAAK